MTRHGCEPWTDARGEAAAEVAEPLLLDERVRAEVLPEGHRRLREHARRRQGHVRRLLPRWGSRSTASSTSCPTCRSATTCGRSSCARTRSACSSCRRDVTAASRHRQRRVRRRARRAASIDTMIGVADVARGAGEASTTSSASRRMDAETPGDGVPRAVHVQGRAALRAASTTRSTMLVAEMDQHGIAQGARPASATTATRSARSRDYPDRFFRHRATSTRTRAWTRSARSTASVSEHGAKAAHVLGHRAHPAGRRSTTRRCTRSTRSAWSSTSRSSSYAGVPGPAHPRSRRRTSRCSTRCAGSSPS